MVRPAIRKIVLSGLLFALVFSAIFAPRFIGIKKFTTGDEPAWLMFAHNFLTAVDRGQFERTAYDYHPAVTTLWVISAGILSYFPEYTQIRHGYIDKFWDLDDIYARYGKALSTVMYRSRMIYVGIISLCLLLAFALLRKQFGNGIALAAILLVSFDPFFLGQSRLLNHEGMAAAFTLVSFLSMLVFLNQGHKITYLLVSGVAAGLALLTKSPMTVLIPLVGLMFLVNFVQDWRQGPRQWKSVWRYLRGYLAWLVVLALVYFAGWPGMWVAPSEMLYRVYGNAVSYAFQGQRMSADQAFNPAGFSLDPSGIPYYLQSFLYKTTPVLWVGVILAIAGLFARGGASLGRVAKQMIGYLLILSSLFILIFGIANGWNSMHYIMVSFVSLEVIAAAGFVWGGRWLAERSQAFKSPFIQAGMLGCLVLMQAVSAFPQYPYYFTYTNPLMQALQPGPQDPSAGYGEGLELAAAYLAQKPGAKNLTVTSHLGVGCFSYYFPGTSHPFMYIGRDYLTDRSANWARQSDYLVIYDIQQDRLDLPTKLLEALQGEVPEHIVYVNGIRYASIYKSSQLSARVFASLEPSP